MFKSQLPLAARMKLMWRSLSTDQWHKSNQRSLYRLLITTSEKPTANESKNWWRTLTKSLSSKPSRSLLQSQAICSSNSSCQFKDRLQVRMEGWVLIMLLKVWLVIVIQPLWTLPDKSPQARKTRQAITITTKNPFKIDIEGSKVFNRPKRQL